MAGGAQKTSQFNQATTVTQADQVPLLQGGELKRVTVGVLTGAPDFGWSATGESWTFSSFNTTTRIGVVTVPSDATTKYSVGMWVRIAQSTGGTKWGMINAVTSTTLSINFFYNQTLNNEAITTPVYSPLAQPYGTPKIPVKNVDANGWTQWDFGTYKEWTKKGSGVNSIAGSAWTLMTLSANLPVYLGGNLGNCIASLSGTASDAAITVSAGHSSTNIVAGLTNQFGGAVNNFTVYYAARIIETS